MWRHFTSTTPVYSKPTLYYSSIGGEGPYSIRLYITSYRIASEVAKLQDVTALPALYGNTPGYGTRYLVQGTSELPKLQIQGHMDTPKVQVGTKVQSTVTLAGNQVSYGDVITTALEGRANASFPEAVDPTYFLDPFGRVFSSPRVTEFSAQYIQGVPFRQNYSLTLQLTKGSSA